MFAFLYKGNFKMAKLTKSIVAAVTKGKKESVAKPKTTPKSTAKVTTKPAAKTPVAKQTRTPRTTKPKAVKPETKPVTTPAKATTKTVSKAAAKTPVKAPVKAEVKKPVEAPKVQAKATLSPRTKKVESKPRKPRKPRTFRTDTSKFRKYNSELRINLRNLIYDKGYTIAKVAREMGILPHYLFNVLKLNKYKDGGNDAVVVLDIAYAVCSVIGVNISSVLPEAEVVNPIYKANNDYVEKINKLQEENVQLNFLFKQTKQQLDAQSVKLTKAEAKVTNLEKIKDKLTSLLKAIEELEESKS
jgi:transposase-like protein